MRLSSASLLLIIGSAMSQTSFSEPPVTRERGGTRHSGSEGEEAGSASATPPVSPGMEQRRETMDRVNRNSGRDSGYRSGDREGTDDKDSRSQGTDGTGPTLKDRY